MFKLFIFAILSTLIFVQMHYDCMFKTMPEINTVTVEQPQLNVSLPKDIVIQCLDYNVN